MQWGEIHGFWRGGKWFGLPGSTGIVPTLKCTRFQGIRRECMFGSSFTMTVIFGADGKPRAWSVLPFGNSEDSASPHFADQAVLYSRNELKPAWTDPREVSLHATRFVTGKYLELWAHPDAPPIRIIPPFASDDTPSVARGQIRFVDEAPLFWQRNTSAPGTFEIELDAPAIVLMPEMQPTAHGTPFFAEQEWFGLDWKFANGQRAAFHPGLRRRALFGLFRPRPLDAAENF